MAELPLPLRPGTGAAVFARLPDRYIVRVEEDVYMHEMSAEERQLAGRPDAFVAAAPERLGQAAAAGGAAPVAATFVPAVQSDRLPYLEVVDRERWSVVTIIELLSPTNKATGSDRTAYLAKRQQWQEGPAHFVEIDLLRAGRRLPLNGLPPCDYYALVSRAAERPRVGVWPVGLRDRLPTIPIPLAAGDADVPLDLRAALDRVYDEAGYARYIYAADLTRRSRRPTRRGRRGGSPTTAELENLLPRRPQLSLALAAVLAAAPAGPARLPASSYDGPTLFRTFDGFAAQCHAAGNVAVAAAGPDAAALADANVGFDYPPFYRPSWGEVFDHVARQMRCRWTVDPASGRFRFERTDAAPPFDVRPAPGWRTEDRGSYVWHAPADQPFGLDVYDFGHYAADPARPDLYARVREHFALRDVAGWPHPPTLAQMATVKVAGVDALYLRADTPRPGGLWRQWSLVADGHAIVMVSAMPRDREVTLGPAVDRMVASFGSLPPPPPTTAPAR